MKPRAATKTFIKASIASAVTMVICVGILWTPFQKTLRSCTTFETFLNHVRNCNWPAAQAMVSSAPEWFRVDQGSVSYVNRDETAMFCRARPLFGKTFAYYLTHRDAGETVYFHGYSSSARADLQNGKIIFVKMP